MDRHERVRPFLYLLVIALSFTLPAWMGCIQAAAGGFGLGAWVMRGRMRTAP